MFGKISTMPDGIYDQLLRMERNMDRMMGAGTRPGGIRDSAVGAYPPVNIGATTKQVDIYLFAAGLNPDAVDVTIHQQLLTISGERRLIQEAGADYYRQERYDGEFRRVITLPGDVDPEKVEAVYRDGILHITVKRLKAAKPKQVKIK